MEGLFTCLIRFFTVPLLIFSPTVILKHFLFKGLFLLFDRCWYLFHTKNVPDYFCKDSHKNMKISLVPQSWKPIYIPRELTIDIFAYLPYIAMACLLLHGMFYSTRAHIALSFYENCRCSFPTEQDGRILKQTSSYIKTVPSIAWIIFSNMFIHQQSWVCLPLAIYGSKWIFNYCLIVWKAERQYFENSNCFFEYDILNEYIIFIDFEWHFSL